MGNPKSILTLLAGVFAGSILFDIDHLIAPFFGLDGRFLHFPFFLISIVSFIIGTIWYQSFFRRRK